MFTTDNILFVVTILSVIFGVFMFFYKPQERLEKTQAINEERDKGKATVLAQKEAEGKASLLAQQVQWEKESNEKKFVEMGVRLTDAMTIAQNHIHTVDTKVDGLASKVGDVEKAVVRLTTIIEERIPKLQVKI